MVGVAAELTMDGFQPVLDALSGFGPADRREALEIMGGVAESAARRRLSDEKQGPHGERWPEWSPAYARTRHANQSLLVSEGHLIDSLQTVVSGEVALVGSPLVYAAIHQFGGEPVGMAIPERPYLGLSGEDELDLLSAVQDFIRGKLHE
ncbi:phage virion morphogenesis protein [Roseospira goensis]|uniref:Phage virion morphogenesis protein n=1 Tax=Roseospira goensis TaxID=391922 RepID=A0A7W6WM60_9PROT|nr:phage virion morphogenesis protein [Roseospira goensis]MBB4287745.1 phage virion morphogenesis protein [Roseospira goensis]